MRAQASRIGALAGKLMVGAMWLALAIGVIRIASTIVFAWIDVTS